MDDPNPRFTSISPGMLIIFSMPISARSGSITHWNGTSTETENIVKIKDKTKVGIDIERIAEENNVRGIFVRNMLERKERENLDEDFIEKAIEIGLEVL